VEERTKQVDNELAVVEEETAFLVTLAVDPTDWLVRFEKSPGFDARAWAENMAHIYNKRLSSPSTGPPIPPGVQPASYEPDSEGQ
jgi:hypothetical protein